MRGSASPVRFGAWARRVACYLVFLATGAKVWAAIAHVGAWINMFNLIPIGPLDGGRGFRALSRSQAMLTTAAFGGAWFSRTIERP